ncbi:hypothetical protein AB0K16_28190 [Nonomuraea jabiensis]|uniref:hypothetical protein n=1 Tax=Nonomuraea jabiensis TaxID=882448 RepID=UPI0034485FAC
MWLVLRNGRPVARAGWWSRSGTRPEVLETLDIDDTCDDPLRIDTGARLLSTALAVRRDGDPVGMVVPARSPNGYVIACLGVTQGQRGQGLRAAGYDNCTRRIDMCWD